ncbi:hypothetical protein [Streptomyces indicus]|uniref:Lipoprotein n=1 Tax=Streptomyces indicus TaxID=417292 RepID=A0A1G9FZ00_9ACTN|nr:hypothetical protein [Streptomyces indicus]SDK93644.1 hypothetical protein SAMN05421806_114150 [Streptomyces indicus]
MKRFIPIGAALLTLGAGATACTGDSGTDRADKPAHSKSAAPEKRCEGGTYTWSDVRERDVLTGVAEVQEIGPEGGKLTQPVKVVRRPKTDVTAERPVIDGRAALFSLARKVGQAEAEDRPQDLAFTDVGRAPADVDSNVTSVDGPGDLVVYTSTRIVEGDFRHVCRSGDAPTTGHATSWSVDGVGVLDCGEAVDGRVAREAARASCPPGSAAVEEPEDA